MKAVNAWALVLICTACLNAQTPDAPFPPGARMPLNYLWDTYVRPGSPLNGAVLIPQRAANPGGTEDRIMMLSAANGLPIWWYVPDTANNQPNSTLWVSELSPFTGELVWIAPSVAPMGGGNWAARFLDDSLRYMPDKFISLGDPHFFHEYEDSLALLGGSPSQPVWDSTYNKELAVQGLELLDMSMMGGFSTRIWDGAASYGPRLPDMMPWGSTTSSQIDVSHFNSAVRVYVNELSTYVYALYGRNTSTAYLFTLDEFNVINQMWTVSSLASAGRNQFSWLPNPVVTDPEGVMAAAHDIDIVDAEIDPVGDTIITISIWGNNNNYRIISPTSRAAVIKLNLTQYKAEIIREVFVPGVYGASMGSADLFGLPDFNNRTQTDLMAANIVINYGTSGGNTQFIHEKYQVMIFDSAGTILFGSRDSTGSASAMLAYEAHYVQDHAALNVYIDLAIDYRCHGDSVTLSMPAGFTGTWVTGDTARQITLPRNQSPEDYTYFAWGKTDRLPGHVGNFMTQPLWIGGKILSGQDTTCSVTTGVQPAMYQPALNVMVYPNPATVGAGITVTANAGMARVNLFNALGQLVNTQTAEGVKSMEIRDIQLSAGIYVVETITTTGATQRQRLLVQ